MDGNNSYSGYPIQPPKKRKSGTDYEERDEKPDLDRLSLLNASTPPESNNSLSQDSPLDFSVKNGSDSVPSPLIISPPSTISPPSARSTPSNSSPPAAMSPVANRFPHSNLEMVGKSMAERMPYDTRDKVVDYSDPGCRQMPETFNACQTKISVVAPTVQIRTEENSNGSHVTNLPLPSFRKIIQTSRKSQDMNAGNFENGFGNPSAEFGSLAKNYESMVNGFSRPMSNDGISSANMTSYNPYLGMLPGAFGTGLINGQGGFLSAQGAILNSQIGLLNGQAGLLGSQGGFMNAQAYKYGSIEANGDKKTSKSARPFKMYEHEILNYPYQTCTPLMPSRFPEIPQQALTVYNPTDSPRNDSPTNQQSNTISRLTNASMEVQRDVSDEYSDESQNSNNAQQGTDANGTRRKGQKYPDEKKDAAYFEKRRKNNLAAKRSRDARRLKEDAIATRARGLVQENTMLRMRLTECQAINMRLESELSSFKRAAYDQRSEIDKLKDEVDRLNRGFAYSNGSKTCDGPESPSLKYLASSH